MSNITYNEAKFEFNELFPDASNNISYWDLVLNPGSNPLEAYRVFKTKEAADVMVGGNNGHYEIYPGALVSVVKDSSEDLNGLYHVEYARGESIHGQDETALELHRIYDAQTVENLIASHTSSALELKLKDSNSYTPGRGTPFIYFAGTDVSTATQSDVNTLYFNDGIAYDVTGNTFVNNSDLRLKNVLKNLDVDVDALSKIDKIVFTWKNQDSDKLNIGVSAQSLEQVYPELVTENPDTGNKMVNYQALSVIALAAIDKLNDRLHAIEEKLGM
jgi:hypothetical protein